MAVFLLKWNLTDATYRRANQQLSQWGFPEPGDLGRPEAPNLVGAALVLLQSDGVDAFEEIFPAARLGSDVIERVVQGATDRPRRLRVTM